ncbi:hypothetical protein NHG22_03640 [Streptomyces sp. ATE26]|uniref:hypothetical protein n=1 Tax=Streptomyces sp. ATE26 TaxID=2954237 RepID=UPI002482A8F7|nr:hypothetical protein [Streptomyces sp. ATE26]MDI1452924.1 hypothetical protein [Streptomyces sp. ATE26]
MENQAAPGKGSYCFGAEGLGEGFEEAGKAGQVPGSVWPRYAVNGTAKDAGYPAMAPIWADDKNLGNGLKVDISEVLGKGRSLC